MCAQPVTGSIASLMKSSSPRPLRPGTHAVPRLQMSPACIGVCPVTFVTDQVALSGGLVRSRDWAAYKLHRHAVGQVGDPEPLQPPGSALPLGPVGKIVAVRR